MTWRGGCDAAIVGGGVVGAACALALAGAGLEVALLEACQPPRWRPERADLRVYAVADDNVALFQSLGVWPAVRAARVQPYRRMCIWDAAGGGQLRFDADLLGRAQLGWIVENALLVDRLWDALHAAGVQIYCPSRLESLEQDARGVRLRLDDSRRLEAAVAIAADGAESTLRALSGLSVIRRDYAQRAVVAFVHTQMPHQSTAWQRFLTTGPLAFLPCADGRSSIVWTLPNAEAARVLALDEVQFARELTNAFAARLGQVQVVSERAAFPLYRQLAAEYVQGRVLVLGDAAHVVHPLAGQGVNLGLRDVAALRTLVHAAMARRVDWAAPHRLLRWARMRRSENTVVAYALEKINRLFSNDALHLTLLRGPLLGMAGRLPPLTDLLWRRASGQR